GSRVSLVLKADIRPGYSGELTAKVERLEAAMENDG
ncbi:MAG: thiamine-binding protein, partial [Leifsonia flava]